MKITYATALRAAISLSLLAMLAGCMLSPI